jgi:hypothetical protein
MNNLILAVALIAVTFSTAFADNRLTQNTAAIKAGRSVLSGKISTLESSLNSHNIQSAQAVANEVLDLMRKGMAQTYDKMNLDSRDKQKEINKHYLVMEKLTHQYGQLSQDVAKNGKQLVSQAQSFLKEY